MNHQHRATAGLKLVLAPCVQKSAPVLADVTEKLSSITAMVTDIQRHDILMVSNELISNAIKYRKPGTSIFIKLKFDGDNAYIEVHNTVHEKSKNGFQKYVTQLRKVDLNEFYVKRMICLRDQFHSGVAKRAMVGILTIIKDCGADLKYRFCSESRHGHPGDFRVIATASLRLGV